MNIMDWYYKHKDFIGGLCIMVFVSCVIGGIWFQNQAQKKQEASCLATEREAQSVALEEFRSRYNITTNWGDDYEWSGEISKYTFQLQEKFELLKGDIVLIRLHVVDIVKNGLKFTVYCGGRYRFTADQSVVNQLMLVDNEPRCWLAVRMSNFSVLRDHVGVVDHYIADDSLEYVEVGLLGSPEVWIDGELLGVLVSE